MYAANRKLLMLSFIAFIMVFPTIVFAQENKQSYSTYVALGSDIKNLESPYLQLGIGINDSPEKLFYLGFEMLLGKIREKYTLYNHNDYSYTTSRYSFGIGGEFSLFKKFKIRPSFGSYLVLDIFKQKISTDDEFVKSVIKNSVSRNSVNLTLVSSLKYTFKPGKSIFGRLTTRANKEPLIHPYILTFGYEKSF